MHRKHMHKIIIPYDTIFVAEYKWQVSEFKDFTKKSQFKGDSVL